VAAASGGKAATAAARPLVRNEEGVCADGHMQVGILLLCLNLLQQVIQPVIQVLHIHIIDVLKPKVV
jgi:hypothetical protein